MTTRLSIRQWAAPVELRGKQTLLEAALAAGVPFPHNCMSGECGACKCRVLDGQVEHGPHLPEALSADERAQGLVLACRSRACGPVAVEWLLPERVRQALPVPRRATVRVVDKTRAAHDVIRLRVAVQGKALHFLPGQYARLRVGRLPARSYSMANLPGEGELEFHIRMVPQGLVSGHIAQRIEAGDTLRLEGPFGNATWQGVQAGPLLLVAGGTGLAPIWSILRAALDDEHPDIHLYHGVRDERDLYDSDELMALHAAQRLRYTPVLSAPQAATPRRTGFVHEVLARDFPRLDTAALYAAGPPPMVEAVRAHALAAGLEAQHIAADAFHPAAPAGLGLLERLRRLVGAEVAAAA
ncbi:MAG TPA: 2Fe-2S iron-sulfur cluster-binding protein [Burkholderiaceae bacterium]|nr:2Fe-2S iron-sulfur cluster-binding protein [Burkholderiaceae bacterium]